MAMWELVISGFECKITTSEDVIPATDPILLSFLYAVEFHRSVVPIAEYRVFQVSPRRFSYRWELEDGRVWLQTLDFSGPVVSMTFDVQDDFTTTEFLPHRAIRDRVIELLNRYDITEIKAEWL